MEGRKLYLRLGVLCALIFLFAGIMLLRLYDLQIVNGLEYSAESEKRITRTVEVAASRGEIVDRYGRKLVTNRISYNVGFDTKLLPSGRENEVVSGLLALAGEHGLIFETNLPLDLTPFGWRYNTTASDSGYTRMGRFIAAIGWGDSENWRDEWTAEELAAALCEEYGIDPSWADARDLLAVRWELDLRSARIGLNIASYIFVSDVDESFIAALKERDLPGVEVLTETVRQYETDYAANLLGRVTNLYDGEYETLKAEGYDRDSRIGRDGVEAAFESILRGVDGVRIEERSESGSVTNVMYSEEPQPGDNVKLTVDIKLQGAAEKALANGIAELKALGEAGSDRGSATVEGGAAVVVDVNTFEILAAANYPTYSLATFYEDYNALMADPLTPMYNRAFMTVLAPGSTFKMSTAVAALESGVISTTTRIYDHGLYTYYAPSYTPACEIYLTQRGSHGSINVVDAIRVSCNYFFYEAGRLAGIDRMNEYAKMLGLGEATGVELPERTGTLAGRESREAAGGQWYGGDTIQAAIGQSDNSFTPLQLAVYVAALVNPDGVRLDAHLLHSVSNYDYSATVSTHRSSVLSTVEISDSTRKAVMSGMRAVASNGSAYASFGNYPIAVGAKTGTAQTGTGAPDGVFVAFAPYEDPQIAVAVIVQKANKGSLVGGIARDIFDAYFRIDGAYAEVEVEGELLN